MTRETGVKILTTVWIANLLVGLLVIFTDLSLNPYRLFYIQISFFVTGIPLINWYEKRTTSTRRLGIWSFLICNAAIAFFYIFLDWRGNWKTQTIEYQHRMLPNRTIEFQLQNKGAMGYNRRRVDRIKLFPFIEWTKEITSEPTDTSTWMKVDIDVNEMELKGG